MMVHLILLWMIEHSAFLIMACSEIFLFHLISQVFGVSLFARHLGLKTLAVLDFASGISNFSNFLAFGRVSWL